MIVKRLERHKEDGTVSIEWVLDPQQQLFLMNFALEFLVAKGLIHVANITEEELKTMEDDLQREITEGFLAAMDTNKMGKA